LRIAVASFLTVAQAAQGKSPTLDETLGWLKTRIDYHDAGAAAAIPTTRKFSYTGCKVTFAHRGFQVTEVALDAISSIRLEEKSDLRWADLSRLRGAVRSNVPRVWRHRREAREPHAVRWTVAATSKAVYRPSSAADQARALRESGSSPLFEALLRHRLNRG
jgi:hypothetical protein